MSPRRAFTLIELLVVVAIIGLLIGILLPSLRTARRHARLVVCSSNMRQIITAVRMYLGDQRDAYPQTMEVVTSGAPQTVSWWAIENYQTAVEPYIGMQRGGVEGDGLENEKQSVWFDPGDPDRVIPAMWGSFSDNGLITGLPRRDSQIRRPAETVYSTLRHADWSAVVDVPLPDPLPVSNPDDPFWQSEFFDMCFDPWAEDVDSADPWHWSRGRALPPATLFPAEPRRGEWDQQIDGRSLRFPDNAPRYGAGQPYAFCDGHVAFMPFERTYADPLSNMWDLE